MGIAAWLFAGFIAYVMVAPDWFTLTVRSGAAGAVRGVVRDIKAGIKGDTGSTTKKTTKGKSKKSGGSAAADDEPDASNPSGTDTSSGPAPATGILDGWREGVRAARARREAGKDTWSRSTKVAGFVWGGGESLVVGVRGTPAKFKAWWEERQAKKAGTDTTEETTEEVSDPPRNTAGPTGPPPPHPPPSSPPPRQGSGQESSKRDPYEGWDIVDAEIVEDTPNQQTPNTAQPNYPAIAGKDTNMAINLTELNSPNAVASEISDAMQVAAAATEILATQREWSTGSPERLHATDWGTDEMRQAATALAEQGALLVFPEGYIAALDRYKAAVMKAQGFGEIVAEHGAHGNADAFKAA